MPKKKNTEAPAYYGKHYNKYTRHTFIAEFKPCDDEYCVQPDQAVSIDEMLRMSARGDLPPMAKGAFHGIDPDMDLDYALPQDFTDIEDRSRELQQLNEQIKEDKDELARQLDLEEEIAKAKNDDSNDEKPSEES